jgi:hypothetical protein
MTGAIISSNGQSRTIIHEIQEHLLLPDYPHTSYEGILHFVHCENPLKGIDNTDKSSICSAFTKFMSGVSLT